MTISALLIRAQSFAEEKLFAVLRQDSVQIVFDTTLFKAQAVQTAFSDYWPRPQLQSVRLVHQQVVGVPGEFYYAVIASDSTGHVHVAKWLERKGDRLYLSDQTGEGGNLEAYYFACVGPQGCDPVVLRVGNKLGWSCSPSPVCTPDQSCKTIKAIHF